MKKIMLLSVFIVTLYSCTNKPNKEDVKPQSNVSETTKTENTVPGYLLRKTEAESNWHYQEEKDEMTEETNKFASIKSDNDYHVGMPYDKDVHCIIDIEKEGSKSSIVYLYLEKGIIWGSDYDGDNIVSVRFDDEKVKNYKFDTDDSGAIRKIKLRNSKDFIDKAKKAQYMKIEVPVFDEGKIIFRYYSEIPLEWEL